MITDALSVSAITTAVVVFTVTNIDDIVLLAVFFGSALRPRAIVIGQFVGIGALTAASALAAYGSLAIPPGWPALLGAIPLGLGLFKLYELWRDRGRADDDDDADAAVAVKSRTEGRTHSQILSVAGVTIANGGDNLSVYIPVFANDVAAVPLFAATFAALTALLCALGYALVKNPAGAALMQRWGHILFPIVLIAIGVQILSGARLLL